MGSVGKKELPDGTLHLAGSKGIANWSVWTGCGPEEPKGCRVSVWKREKWLIIIELMICFLIVTERTQLIPDHPNLGSLPFPRCRQASIQQIHRFLARFGSKPRIYGDAERTIESLEMASMESRTLHGVQNEISLVKCEYLWRYKEKSESRKFSKYTVSVYRGKSNIFCAETHTLPQKLSVQCTYVKVFKCWILCKNRMELCDKS